VIPDHQDPLVSQGLAASPDDQASKVNEESQDPQVHLATMGARAQSDHQDHKVVQDKLVSLEKKEAEEKMVNLA